jgi:hypothetical protein
MFSIVIDSRVSPGNADSKGSTCYTLDTFTCLRMLDAGAEAAAAGAGADAKQQLWTLRMESLHDCQVSAWLTCLRASSPSPACDLQARICSSRHPKCGCDMHACMQAGRHARAIACPARCSQHAPASPHTCHLPLPHTPCTPPSAPRLPPPLPQVLGSCVAQLISSMLAASPAALAPLSPPALAQPLCQLLTINSEPCQAACLEALATLAALLPASVELPEAAVQAGQLALRAWSEGVLCTSAAEAHADAGGLAGPGSSSKGAPRLSRWQQAAIRCLCTGLQGASEVGMLVLYAADAASLLLDCALVAPAGSAFQHELLALAAQLLAEQPGLARSGSRLLPLLQRQGSWCAGLQQWLAAYAAWLASPAALPLLLQQLRASPALAHLLGPAPGAQAPAAAAAAAVGGSSVSPAKKKRKLRQTQLAVGQAGVMMTQRTSGTQAARSRLAPVAPVAAGAAHAASTAASLESSLQALPVLSHVQPLLAVLASLQLGHAAGGSSGAPATGPAQAQALQCVLSSVAQLASAAAAGGPSELLVLLAAMLASWLGRQELAEVVREEAGAAALLQAASSCCSALVLRVEAGQGAPGQVRQCVEAAQQLLGALQVCAVPRSPCAGRAACGWDSHARVALRHEHHL